MGSDSTGTPGHICLLPALNMYSLILDESGNHMGQGWGIRLPQSPSGACLSRAFPRGEWACLLHLPEEGSKQHLSSVTLLTVSFPHGPGESKTDVGMSNEEGPSSAHIWESYGNQNHLTLLLRTLTRTDTAFVPLAFFTVKVYFPLSLLSQNLGSSCAAARLPVYCRDFLTHI